MNARRQPRGSAPYRILCMDGGGSLAVTTVELLKRIEGERPGFLQAVDMFAGTSAGGIVALILASSDLSTAQRCKTVLDRCEKFWEHLPTPSAVNLLEWLGGWRPFVGNRQLQRLLDDRFGHLTLGDLSKDVAIPTFALSGYRLGRRTWKPKIFHNVGAADDPDRQARATDVALYTSAAPVYMPIYQGHVDGGLFANNPSLCALVQALPDRTKCPSCGRTLRGRRCQHCGASISGVELDVDEKQIRMRQTRNGTARRIEDIQLFSIGYESIIWIKPRSDAWGWRQWLFDRQHPMLLLEAQLSSDSMAIDYQCFQLLGRERYFRLEPMMKKVTSRNILRHGHIEYLRQGAQDTDLDAPLRFLGEVGWGTQTPRKVGRTRRVKPAKKR